MSDFDIETNPPYWQNPLIKTPFELAKELVDTRNASYNLIKAQTIEIDKLNARLATLRVLWRSAPAGLKEFASRYGNARWVADFEAALGIES